MVLGRSLGAVANGGNFLPAHQPRPKLGDGAPTSVFGESHQATKPLAVVIRGERDLSLSPALLRLIVLLDTALPNAMKQVLPQAEGQGESAVQRLIGILCKRSRIDNLEDIWKVSISTQRPGSQKRLPRY